jgi:hypothetical protein
MSNLKVINDAEQSALVSNARAKNGEMYLKASGSTNEGDIVVYYNGSWIRFDNEYSAAAAFQNRWGASFDGSGSYLTTNNSVLNFYNTGGSISAWIKPSSVTSTLTDPYKNRSIINKGNVYLSLNVDESGYPALYFYDGAVREVVATTQVSTSSWMHICATWSTTGSSIYVNGTSEATSSETPANITSGQTGATVYIGRTPASSVDFFGGSIDELAVFNTELSSSNVSTIYNSGVPTDISSLSPKTYYRFGDDSNDSPSNGGSIASATDSSGNGNDATQSTASNQPTFKALDQSTGTSVSFDGSNDYLTVTQNSDINITGDLTVSSWVRLSQISGYNAILTKRTVGGSMNYQFIVDGSGRIGLGHSGGSWVYDTNSLTVDTWHHVAATVSSGTVQFYIDGVAKTSDTGLTITGDTNDLTIGATLGYNYFTGTINEVAIFSTALSTSDITSLAASQTAHIVNDLSLSPVAYYRMGEDDSLTDGASASQISDASGNGNHATQATASAQPTASIDPVIYV